MYGLGKKNGLDNIENLWNIAIGLFLKTNRFVPWHEISNNVVCATSEASDQSAHARSLIRAFASHANILFMLIYWPNIIWSSDA